MHYYIKQTLVLRNPVTVIITRLKLLPRYFSECCCNSFCDYVLIFSSFFLLQNNIKYLILKKKYRGSSILTDSNLSLSSLLGSTTSLSELLGAAQGTLPASSDGSNNTITPNCPLSTTDTSSVSSQSNHRAMSEPPSVQQTPSSPMEISIEVPTQPTTDDGISKCKSETNLRNSKVTEFRDSNSTISSSSLTSTVSQFGFMFF